MQVTFMYYYFLFGFNWLGLGILHRLPEKAVENKEYRYLKRRLLTQTEKTK